MKEERYEDVLEAVHALKRGCRNPWNDGTVPGSIRGSSFHT